MKGKHYIHSTKYKSLVNARGTTVRRVTVYHPIEVTELSYQFVMEQWVPYKRVVHAVALIKGLRLLFLGHG